MISITPFNESDDIPTRNTSEAMTYTQFAPPWKALKRKIARHWRNGGGHTTNLSSQPIDYYTEQEKVAVLRTIENFRTVTGSAVKTYDSYEFPMDMQTFEHCCISTTEPVMALFRDRKFTDMQTWSTARNQPSAQLGHPDRIYTLFEGHAYVVIWRPEDCTLAAFDPAWTPGRSYSDGSELKMFFSLARAITNYSRTLGSDCVTVWVGGVAGGVANASSGNCVKLSLRWLEEHFIKNSGKFNCSWEELGWTQVEYKYLK